MRNKIKVLSLIVLFTSTMWGFKPLYLQVNQDIAPGGQTVNSFITFFL